jgi:hypothetical protein
MRLISQKYTNIVILTITSPRWTRIPPNDADNNKIYEKLKLWKLFNLTICKSDY